MEKEMARPEPRQMVGTKNPNYQNDVQDFVLVVGGAVVIFVIILGVIMMIANRWRR